MKRLSLVLALLACACVTTRTQDPDASPDPRGKRMKAVDAREAPGPRRALRVVSDLSNRDPLVNVRILFEAGSRDDPPGKEGLTALTAALMAEATQDLSASALRDVLYPMAAETGVSVDKDVTVFVGRVHADHAPKFFGVFRDLVVRPRLDPADFERLRAEHVSWIETTLRTGDDEKLQREALDAAIHDAPGHPYRFTPTGTVAGLKAITLDDVKAQVRAVFARDRAILGVSGGASQALVDELRAAIDALPDAARPRPALPPQVDPPATTVRIIDKPSAGTAISIGFGLALDRNHPDYAAMKLAETWFGEHRNMVGWLFNAMREKRGLNYGDYAYVEHFVQEGWSTYEKTNTGRPQQYFSIWIRPVEHQNRHFALRQAVYELRRFVERGIPDDESFRRVQSFVQGYWRAKEQHPMRRLGYAMDAVYYGTDMDRDALRAKAATLTREQVNAAIRRHLRGDRLHVVVVTQDGEAFRRALLENAPSPIAYAGAVSEDVLREDAEIVRVDLGLDPARVQVVKPDALFAK